jgi:hypothetical protein
MNGTPNETAASANCSATRPNVIAAHFVPPGIPAKNEMIRRIRASSGMMIEPKMLCSDWPAL